MNKQEIQCRYDDAMQQLSELQTRVKELAEELKVANRWEPRGGKWVVDILGQVVNGTDLLSKNTSKQEAIKFGVCRTNQSSANEAAKRMRSYNRLLAYKDEFDASYEWKFNGHNCYVAYDYRIEEWAVQMHFRTNVPSIVYMSECAAKILVDKLNNGEVVF